MSAVRALWWREVVRFVRQRSRVIGSLLQPVVFWLLLGGGLSASFRPDAGDGRTVIADVNPVADVQTVAVDRHRLIAQQVADEQRDQLLGELVGTVVVAAARDDRGQAERVDVTPHQEVGRRLAR